MSEGGERPVKALIIHNYLSPYRIPLFQELAGRFDLDVWILGDIGKLREWQEPAEDPGFRWRRLPNIGIGLGSRYARLTINPALPVDLARSKHDVIICCGWDMPAMFYAAAYARATRTPFVLWAGSTPRETTFIRRVTMAPVRWLVRSADAWIAYGTRAKDYLVSIGADSYRTVCAYNTVGIDAIARAAMSADDVNAIRDSIGLDDGPVILYCGNVLRLKGVDVLIRAFAKLLQLVPTAQLVIVGGGKDAGNFRQLAADLKIDSRVHWVGYAPPDTIGAYYGLADVFVLPSRSEVWGLVLNEAMAAGLPVIASDAAGAAADLVIENEAGFTFPSEDAGSLADRLAFVLSPECDRSAMGEAARSHIAGFTIGAMGDAFVRAVDMALDRRAR